MAFRAFPERIRSLRQRAVGRFYAAKKIGCGRMGRFRKPVRGCGRERKLQIQSVWNKRNCVVRKCRGRSCGSVRFDFVLAFCPESGCRKRRKSLPRRSVRKVRVLRGYRRQNHKIIYGASSGHDFNVDNQLSYRFSAKKTARKSRIFHVL